jgi:hydrogenase nickel incorporation protein HypB
MFRACELVLLNKVDLLAHVEFDVDQWAARLQTVHPGVTLLPVSAGAGTGVEAFRDLLATLPERRMVEA